eukprot:2472752-Prymnesium_polylepis.3
MRVAAVAARCVAALAISRVGEVSENFREERLRVRDFFRDSRVVAAAGGAAARGGVSTCGSASPDELKEARPDIVSASIATTTLF